MREWVESTVVDILRLKPKRVYEIGCGTGMLLARIAPHCDRYLAADFSSEVLARLNGQLRKIPALAEKVELLERTADNFEGLQDQSFDTVILSSVVQYFPNASYLRKVLEDAVRIIAPGGCAYVGDVRNLPLLPAFAASVELFQATDETNLDRLRERITRRIERESELLVSPPFFLDLQRRLPKSTKLEIRPLRSRARNEMSKFRYQAILHVQGGIEATTPVEFVDWSVVRCNLDQIRSRMQRFPNDVIGIKGIPNARIESDLQALALIREGDSDLKAETLRNKLKLNAETGIDPQALFELETQDLGFSVFLSWAACNRQGRFDACLVPRELLQINDFQAIPWPQPEPSDFVHLANRPGQNRHQNDFIHRLVKHCAENQVNEINATNLRLVDSLPRGSSDDADVDALLANVVALFKS